MGRYLCWWTISYRRYHSSRSYCFSMFLKYVYCNLSKRRSTSLMYRLSMSLARFICSESLKLFPRSWLITGFVTRLIRRVSLMEQELLTLPDHLSSPPVFSFICIFCRSLFVLLYFFFWPLCCLFFFDTRIMIAPLVPSISSYLAI